MAGVAAAAVLGLVLAGCGASGGSGSAARPSASPTAAGNARAATVDGRRVWAVDRSLTEGPEFDGTRVFLLEVTFPAGRRQVTLTAYTPDDGRRRWGTPVCEDATILPVGDAASGVLVVNCATRGVWGVDLATGERRWRTEVAPELDLNIGVTRDHVLLDDLEQVVVLDRRSGDEVLVRTTAPDAAVSARLVGDQVVLAGPDGVEAVGLDGSPRWTAPGPAAWVFDDGDRAVVTAVEAPVRIIDARGEEVGRLPALAPDVFPTAVTGGHLLTYSMDGEEAALDLATGRAAWRIDSSWAEGPTVRVAADGLIRVDPRTGDQEVREIATQRPVAAGPGTVVVHGAKAITVVSVPGKGLFWLVPRRGG